jgi:hypothetical protein
MKPDELDRLIHRYFEGDLSPEEEGLLWSVVRIDPSAADRFVELSELESAMVESLQAEEAVPPEVKSTNRTSRRLRVVTAPDERRPVWVLFLAAGLMIGFLALLLQSADKPQAVNVVRQEPPKTPPMVTPAPVAPQPVAPPSVNPRPTDSPAPTPRETPFVVPVPKPLPPAPAEPKTPEKTEAPVPEKTVVAVEKKPEATIAKIDGEVVDDAGVAVKLHQPLASGQGLEVRKGSVIVALADTTQVELRADTKLEKFLLLPDQKKFQLARGGATATVAKQAGKMAVVFQTPHAEVTVIGTKLVIDIHKESTQVDVHEGRVRCKRLPDGATTEIAAGRFATAGKGLLLSPRPIPMVRIFQDGVAPTPDYKGTTDTVISSKEPGANFGKIEQLQLQRLEFQQTALIRWDVSSIPAGSRVLSAEITFWVTGKLVGDCKVYALNLPFDELEANYRMAKAGLMWRTLGAQSDQDRGTVPVSAIAPEKMGFHTAFLDPATVQGWVNQPGKNFGILIAGPDANIWGLEARETATPERRPKLTITYISGK